MKFPTMVAVGSAVALASATYARPSLFKRFLAGTTEFLGCLGEAVFERTVSPTCKDSFGIDIKYVEKVEVDYYKYVLGSEKPTFFAFNNVVTLMAVPGVPSMPFVQAAYEFVYWNGASAMFSIDSPATKTSVVGNILTTDVPESALVVTADQKAALIDHLTSAITGPGVSVTYHGHVNTILDFTVPGLPVPDPASSFFGNIAKKISKVLPPIVKIPGLSISATVALRGYNNFVDLAATVVPGQTFTVSTVGNVEQVRVRVSFPSTKAQVYINFGSVTLQVAEATSAPGSLGLASVSDFKLGPKDNTFELVISSTTPGQLGKVFGATTGLKLTINGFSGSSTTELANAVLAKVKFVVAF